MVPTLRWRNNVRVTINIKKSAPLIGLCARRIQQIIKEIFCAIDDNREKRMLCGEGLRLMRRIAHKFR